MYVDRFILGIIATIGFVLLLILVYAIIQTIKKNRRN